jgi:hypothetical protein
MWLTCMPSEQPADGTNRNVVEFDSGEEAMTLHAVDSVLTDEISSQKLSSVDISETHLNRADSSTHSHEKNSTSP